MGNGKGRWRVSEVGGSRSRSGREDMKEGSCGEIVVEMLGSQGRVENKLPRGWRKSKRTSVRYGTLLYSKADSTTFCSL